MRTVTGTCCLAHVQTGFSSTRFRPITSGIEYGLRPLDYQYDRDAL